MNLSPSLRRTLGTLGVLLVVGGVISEAVILRKLWAIEEEDAAAKTKLDYHIDQSHRSMKNDGYLEERSDGSFWEVYHEEPYGLGVHVKRSVLNNHLRLLKIKYDKLHGELESRRLPIAPYPRLLLVPVVAGLILCALFVRLPDDDLDSSVADGDDAKPSNDGTV
jgi:hypothetical protein